MTTRLPLSEMLRDAFKVFFERTTDAVFVHDLTGRFIEVNDEACARYGYTRAELLAMSPQDLDAPEDAALVPARIRELRERGRHTFEVHHVTKSGERIPIEITSLLIEHGENRYILSICRDIAGRRRAEQAIRASERAFREMLENVSMIAVMLDAGGRLSFCNEALLEATGWTREQVIGSDWFSTFLPADAQAEVRAVFARIIDSSEPVAAHYQNEIVARDGRRRLVFWNNTARRDAEGRVVGTASIGIDVTEQDRAARQLRHSEARLRQVIDLVPHFIFAKDVSGRFILVNKAVADAYGTTVERLIGRTDAEFDPSEEEVRHFREDDLEVIQSGQPKFVPIERITNARGQVRLLQTIKIPFTASDMALPAVLGVSTDITDLKRAEYERLRLEAQIQQTQKLESLGILAGGIAHDFNNLLVAILGNAGLAMLDLPPDAPARTKVAHIERTAQRAADLTHQLLAYSGKGQFHVAPIDLSAHVLEMSQLLRTAIPRAISLRLNLSEAVPAVEADATQVRQVVMNLITNAAEAIGPGAGTITLSTGVVQARKSHFRHAYPGGPLPAGPYVYLDVADTGVGMDEETIDKIFDPFFTTKFAGRGLGLAAVLGIVRGHRGALKVCSQPGRGTTFRVLFPASARPVPLAPEPESPSGAMWRGSGTVLVVDDDQSVRELARDMLERAGFAVIMAADGREAVELYGQNAAHIRAVLLDLTMPDMNGETTLRKLRESGPVAPVILSSGYTEQDAALRFGGLRLAGFLQKPYRLGDLLRALRRALEQA